MREILFRGKTDKGEWVYGVPVPVGEFTEMHDFDFEYQKMNEPLVSEKTVGQYTGLTDKNGKKIFEGDVLNVYSLFGATGCRSSVVEWSDLFLCFKAGDCSLYGDGLQTYEVIGNVHDNPELLERGVNDER